jgi:uncharacterized protein (UPF0276 family)
MIITAGLGFKLGYLDDALASQSRGLWFEVHAENYMVDGGPRRAALLALAQRFPIAIHGVGLSLASVEPPSTDHIGRLKRLVEEIRPWAVSDHLAWQKWQGAHHADFLPFPRTREALDIVVRNIIRVQDGLGRSIMVENPSLYVDLPGHELSETQFLAELVARSGCRLLVDINNVFVSAHNLGHSAEAWLDDIAAEHVGEIHLAGHSIDEASDGTLLVDSHDAAVAHPVWNLFWHFIKRIGPRPTLIERDGNVPSFAEMMAEREVGQLLLAESKTHHV